MIEMTVPIARMKRSSRAVDVASRASFPRRWRLMAAKFICFQGGGD